MDQVKAQLQDKTAILDQFGDKIPPLKDFSKKQGINSGLPLGIACFILMLIMLIVQGKEIFVLLVTVIYPSLHSIRAISSKDDNDDKIWLTYWMIFGFFHIIETFFSFILYFIPYYSWIRIGLFSYLLIPQFNGVEKVYTGVVKKLLDENKELIQRLLKETESIAASVEASVMDLKKDALAAATDPNLLAQGLSVVGNV